MAMRTTFILAAIAPISPLNTVPPLGFPWRHFPGYLCAESTRDESFGGRPSSGVWKS